jgi:type III restriction enzyme
MIMHLNQYQQETLDILRRFLELARVAGPASAYETVRQEPDQKRRLGRFAGAYSILEGLPAAPYVCLRLPTGGGKTILGAHAIPVARDAWIEKDYPLVLWLVPTNTIRRQTADALKNTRHPYRQVLDESFSGRVRVFDIADFAQVRPQDIRDNLIIIVGTIQTLRVANTEGRKIYAHHEEMEPHFSGVAPTTPDLERFAEGENKGKIKFSFANLLHLHRPLMVVDEAHNAVTGLSRDMQVRVNPCAIIEFTATPRVQSNILHSVTALELKREEMIKLPIVLAEHDSWQNAVNGAIGSRAALDRLALKEAEYLRPIILFQAQNADQDVTVEVLKKHLIEVEHIDEAAIAIATGEQRELDGIDLFDPKCPITCVITVEALKEGWDCSFAYVFCSVARIKDAGDVEQLLGRVLRMPYAKRRKSDELNKAYAHVSESTFGEAARALTDRLVGMGFDEEEAREAIEPAQGTLDDTGLFAPREKPLPVFRHKVEAGPAEIAALRSQNLEGLAVSELDDGAVEISVTGNVTPEVEAAIVSAVPAPVRKQLSEAVAHYRKETKQELSPAQRREPFDVPRLTAEIQGRLEFVDSEILMEVHDWSLLNHPADLTAAEFDVRATARSFEIDLDGNHITYQFAHEEAQLPLDIDVAGWTPENLVIWLDRYLRQPDIQQSVLLRWVRDCVDHLTAKRGLHIAALMRAKFILARKLKEKIDGTRQEEQRRAYQQYLFDPGAVVSVSFDDGFEFKEGMYRDQKRHRYDGRFRFSRHYLGPNEVPAFDGVEGGEEYQCAQMIDSLPTVKYWIRNVARHPNSFWLPLAAGKFYPDFVALLDDGRTLVVEYKGAHIADSGDTNEKRTIGRLWEQKSGGRGLFLVVEKEQAGLDMRAQIIGKIGA